MSKSRYNPIADEGINAVGLIFNKKFKWIFREQPKADMGIDAHIEVCRNGNPLGKLLALQIKSGESWFKEESDGGFIYRGSLEHLKYWDEYSLPVIIVLYNPRTEKAYWQIVFEYYINRTPKRWKITIPYVQELNETAIPKLLEYAREKLDASIPQCMRMQEVITHLTEKHNFDLKTNKGKLELMQKGFDPLLIKKLDQNIVSISHLYNPQDDVFVCDPCIEFFVFYDSEEDWFQWTPISMTTLMGGKQIFGRIEDGELKVIDREEQKAIAYYANSWAKNLRLHKWIENGYRVDN